MRRLWLMALVMLVPLRVWAASEVVNTVHNLSTSGPGSVRSLTVDQVCVFCHTPHSPLPVGPLWNREVSGATYVEYGSSTLRASPGQPTGNSRFCLSCHDGTVALGALGNPPTRAPNDLANTFLTGRSSLGTDLADDHPVSFRYDATLRAGGGRLAQPATTGLPLENQELQCSSCHDPHEKDIAPFLHRTTRNGELCTACHEMTDGALSWEFSAHARSPARPRAGAGPWNERKPEWRGRSVAENACFNCHRPHNAATPERLIKDREDDTCLRCHDGTVAATDIVSETLKTYRHGADMSMGGHDPAEDFTRGPRNTHVACADCHNPHLAGSGSARAPLVAGAVQGVKGIDSSGVAVGNARTLDEVCYKCHADNPMVTTAKVTRQIFELNTRLEFDIGGPSQHPVQGFGRNRDVPSLIPPLTETSVIYCTDCHNNDNGPGNGGRGASGPHGSVFEGLLERNYATADNTTESTLSYALCYKCHDRSSILGDQSFPEHDKHVRGENTPCSACHDPHGISAALGNATNNSHLINLDATIVSPNGLGEGPVFEDLGTVSGQCSLTCHARIIGRIVIEIPRALLLPPLPGPGPAVPAKGGRRVFPSPGVWTLDAGPQMAPD